MPTRRGAADRVSRRVQPAPSPDSEVAGASSVPAATPEPAASPPATRPKRTRNPRFPIGCELVPFETDAPSGSWYGYDVSADLAAMHAAGLSLVRVTASWRVMEPQAGAYDDEAFDRLTQVVSEAGRHGMRVIVTLFSADPLGEPASLSWGARRDPHVDPYLLDRAAEFATRVAARVRGELPLFAWQLADEAFWEGFTSADDVAAWTRRISDAIRATDPQHPVTLGTDPETLARATAVDARAAGAEGDFAMSHLTRAYAAFAAPGPAASGPSTRIRGFLTQCARDGRPIFADGIGALSLDSDAREEASELRLAVAGSLAHGASGAILSRWRDATIGYREPYRVDDHETLVGVCDEEGRPKASHRAVRDLAAALAPIELEGLERFEERVAVVMPDERLAALPSLGSVLDPRAAFVAWTALREAQIPATVVYEGDAFEPYSALVVASPFGLGGATWARLDAFAEAGGTIVLSYGGGDADPAVRSLFGVEFLGDDGARDTLGVRVAQPGALGDIRSFDAKLALPAFALLAAVDATVVATDPSGNPLVTTRAHGQGRAIFVAAPAERALALADLREAPVGAVAFVRTYLGAAAAAAGCSAPVEADSPDVELGLLQGGSSDVVVLLNHAAEKRTVTISCARVVANISVFPTDTPVPVDAPTFELTLPRGGVSFVRVVYA